MYISAHLIRAIHKAYKRSLAFRVKYTGQSSGTLMLSKERQTRSFTILCAVCTSSILLRDIYCSIQYSTSHFSVIGLYFFLFLSLLVGLLPLYPQNPRVFVLSTGLSPFFNFLPSFVSFLFYKYTIHHSYPFLNFPYYRGNPFLPFITRLCDS